MSTMVPLSQEAKSEPYKLVPLSPVFGATVEGIKLDQDTKLEVLRKIEDDLYKYRLLLFRDQGKMSAETQLAMSRHFGPVESTFYRHPKSPHKDIFRVSNDPEEGCTRVGRSGWHIDGTFLEKPFAVQTMHFWSTNSEGSTLFAPLKELIESLSDEERADWEKLFFVGDSSVHPLVYPHPVTKQPTLCFHLGDSFFRCFAREFNPKQQKAEVLDPEESNEIRKRLVSLLESPDSMLEVKWKAGDFALIDNLAVGHFASAGTQAPRHRTGLRILHRTTVSGKSVPLSLKLEKSDLGDCKA